MEQLVAEKALLEPSPVSEDISLRELVTRERSEVISRVMALHTTAGHIDVAAFNSAI